MTATTGAAQVQRAEERLLQAALRSLLAERGLTDPDGNVLTVAATGDRLRIAAKDLTDAVDALPDGEKPKGWGTA